MELAVFFFPNQISYINYLSTNNQLIHFLDFNKITSGQDLNPRKHKLLFMSSQVSTNHG